MIFHQIVKNRQMGTREPAGDPRGLNGSEKYSQNDAKTRKKNKENCKKWRDKSITDDGTVVVPISISNKKHVKWRNSSIRGGGGLRFYPSKVLLADYFPIEPGFSITIHKAQVCGFGCCYNSTFLCFYSIC